MSRSCFVLPLLSLAGLFGLAGCNATDPLTRTDLWHPMDTNAMNIAAQVAMPSDLVRGRQAAESADGQEAAAAIRRLRQDRVKPLQASGVTDFQVSGSAVAVAPAAAAAGDE